MWWYMIWYDKPYPYNIIYGIWYDMIWYMIWYDMIWYGMIWYDVWVSKLTIIVLYRACGLVGAKPICQLNPLGNKLQWNINTLRPRQNGRHFPDYISICIFMKMYACRLRFYWSLFVSVELTKIPALVQIMACCRSGDKPLSWQIVVRLLTARICATRPQWVNHNSYIYIQYYAFEHVVCEMLAILPQVPCAS